MYRRDCGDERPVFWLTCSLCGSRGGSSAGKYHEAYGADVSVEADRKAC